MAVYERTYKPYEGALSPEWSRFLILPRYTYRRVFQSRLFLTYFVACFLPSAVAALWIYFHHNLSAFQMLRLDPQAVATVLPVDGWFFWFYLTVEGAFAFFLSLFVGPALISPDLTHNGLALYLSRPFSRWDYILGKFCVLAILISWITWIPATVLFLFQSYLEGWSWFVSNLWIGAAILLASWIWILLLSLMNMAASAWVRQRVIAGILVLAFFYVSRGMGAAINLMYRTSLGDLIDVNVLSNLIWRRLFGLSAQSGLPTAVAWAALLAFCGLCLMLLLRKVRAYQVAR
jgi:ABC-2 type transport system permease protein